jgi:hypothetical protein
MISPFKFKFDHLNMNLTILIEKLVVFLSLGVQNFLKNQISSPTIL